MEILVTGASGFIGSNLCKALCEKGHVVHAFYRPRPDNEVPALIKDLEVVHHQGDITDFESICEATKDVDVIFHTAAKLGSSGPLEELYATTVGGTIHALKAAKMNGVQRLIHTSSVAALGVPGWNLPLPNQPQPIDEFHSWNYKPGWWRYGYAKHLAEREVQKAVASGQDVVIVNPSVVMGPGDINRIGGEVLFQVSKGLFPVSLPGGLNIVHIQDVVRGQIAAMSHGKPGERYILAGENITHLEFHQMTARMLGVKIPSRVIPEGPVRGLAGIMSLFEGMLPISSSFLRRIGYFFYYKNKKACVELQMGTFLKAEQSISDAYDWYRMMKLLP